MLMCVVTCWKTIKSIFTTDKNVRQREKITGWTSCMIIKGLILFFIWLCNVAHRVRASFYARMVNYMHKCCVIKRLQFMLNADQANDQFPITTEQAKIGIQSIDTDKNGFSFPYSGFGLSLQTELTPFFRTLFMVFLSFFH